jgi:hypothetical protein
MLNIVLNNVEHVEQVRHLLHERFAPLLREFPDLREHQLTIVVDGASEAERMGGRSMSISAIVQGRRYRVVALVQTVSDIYAASANVAGRLWRRLKRIAQRTRTEQRYRPAVQNAA